MAFKSRDAVIRKEVRSVQFGFYTDADVRERSVLEVTSPVPFDPNGSPLPGGLYDPRLGPTHSSLGGSCPTCALGVLDCPGHFGHLELAVPCYHPLLFGDVVAFLRLKCFACHRLRAEPHLLDSYVVKFHLLREGRVDELLGLDAALAGASSAARGRAGSSSASPGERRLEPPAHHPSALAKIGAAGAADALSRYLAEFSRPRGGDGRRRRPTVHLSSHQREIRKRLAGELAAACRAKSCPHCGQAPAPAVRGDASNKVFVKHPTKGGKNKLSLARAALESALSAEEGRGKGSGDRPGASGAADGNDSEDTEPEDVDDDSGSGGDDDDNDDSSSGGGTQRGAASQGGKEVGEAAAAANASGEKYMHPGEVEAQVRRTWELHPFLCACVFGDGGGDADRRDEEAVPSDPSGRAGRSAGPDKFFLRAVPVPPSRFRPSMKLGIMTVEHSQTQHLGRILQLNNLVRTHLKEAQQNGDGGASSSSSSSSKAYTAWMDLQTAVNCFIDSSKDPSAGPNNPAPPGIRQVLERKEGLFRKNMMGKRVDHACRSVISPDPYIGTNEIGLPRHFATVLTYPTPVTDWNAQRMRALVERGTDCYPGARWVEMGGRRVDLTKMTRFKREALAANLLSSLKTGTPAVVGRQLADGDYVLMNRQPTLHKPGIMAHRVRILHNPTQKTIRMHYANCNTYNADYDGDEMNCHFPQGELARAEAVHIARTDYQYIVPTDGTPLRGLIQDHVVGGVKLTKRDTFLERWEYQQLLFAALSSLNGLEVVPHEVDIEMLPPAIMKPRMLWTGKQVVSTLLLHLCRTNGKHRGKSASKASGLSLERKAKTPETAFGPKQEEHLVLVRDGELLRGVLDKAAFGATDFSLVHGIYESYGPEKAGLLLNALGRLFTAYIQYFAGHSCRMEDLMLTESADRERRALVERSYNQGARAAKAWADSDGGKTAISPISDQLNSGAALPATEAAAAAAKIASLLSGTEGKQNHAALDAYMQSQLNPLSSKIVKQCLPSGLSVPFPYNSFSIMTVTGAKGSIVNQSQVSCALGQQALEGRRVPRMSSGRTLPSFAPFDPHPRADGFVLDRFLTGVRPQEYYFHCMAGREGLVDTAVKTSRSGYLQRCLVKHLEELKISYDLTVRNAEGGVVQFLYGEDGLDPTKASYLDCTDKSFDFMVRNYDALNVRNTPLPNSSIEKARTVALGTETMTNGNSEFPYKGARVFARRLRVGNDWKRGSLCRGWHKAVVTKVHKNGKFVDLRYDDDSQVVARVPVAADFGDPRESLALRTLSTMATIVKPACEDPVLCSGSPELRVGVNGACVSERIASASHQAMQSPSTRAMMARSGITREDMSRLVGAKYSCSLCPPGEAVGCIAAQSVGEPSTQMTLNTFHLAGSGANVTLGIPRLREVIMTASREPKTPTMSVPLNASVSSTEATRLTRRLTKLNLMELIASVKGIHVKETIECLVSDEWTRNYYITIKLHPAKRIQEAFGLSIHMVAAVVTKSFVPRLAKIMRAELRRSFAADEITGGEASDYVPEGDHGVEEQDGTLDDLSEQQEMQKSGEELDDDAPTEEDGADASRYRQRSDSASYDDEEDENNGETSDDGGEQVHRSQSVDREASRRQVTPMKTPSNEPVTLTVNQLASTIALQPLSVDPASPPLLMVDLVERAACATLLRSIKGIQEAFVNEEDGRGRCLQTAGVNFEEVWKLDNVDHDRLMSNDIWAIRCAYGVEAARTSIVNQITSVFGAYGITVDPRHLSLIADYMTFDGGYKPLSRIGMESSSSPLLQMSFETTVNFLKQAAMLGLSDDLRSPSANLVLGLPVRDGTGSFALLAGASRR